MSTDIETDIVETNPNIKHIVISGGGHTGFTYFGLLYQSHKEGFWNIDNIKTLYGVSCGSILIFILATVKYIGWEDYMEYVVKRPWGALISPENVLNAYGNLGICGKETLVQVFEPILSALELSLNITLQEFYEFNGIEIHLYTTNLDTNELVDISYKTHPEWELIDAVYSSCAIPVLFKPIKINDKRYADGGLLCNYPINQCIQQIENPREVFGINKKNVNSCSNTNHSNIIEYLASILELLMSNKLAETLPGDIYNVNIYDHTTNAWCIYDTINSKENLTARIKEGVDRWREYALDIGFSSYATVSPILSK